MHIVFRERHAKVCEARNRRADDIGSELESSVAGFVVDSWVESASIRSTGARLVLQVAPRAQPAALVIVLADASLVFDRFWLEDLSENLCHGSPVLAFGSRSSNGFFAAHASETDTVVPKTVSHE